MTTNGSSYNEHIWKFVFDTLKLNLLKEYNWMSAMYVTSQYSQQEDIIIYNTNEKIF